MLASSHPLVWLESPDALRRDSGALPSNRPPFKHMMDERQATGGEKRRNA
jgi:hypothetical protein